MNRNDEIIKQFKSGLTLREVGHNFGLTAEGIRKILLRCGVAPSEGGCSLNVSKARSKSDKKFLLSRGCDRDTYNKIRKLKNKNGATPQRLFRCQKKNASDRKIEWRFNFYEWWTLWQESGKWESRGRERGCYVMCRRGDTGPYSKDNVYIDTCSNNLSEGFRIRRA